VLLFHLLQNITGLGTKPVMAIVQKSSTGKTNVIAGLATGMISHFLPFYCLLLQFGLLTLAGFYGVALAASAMMATAMQLAIDALDLSDNAGGIAEMSEPPKKCAHVLIF
jgi:K(+)-stimulated pyrophosphate-energized sodium pump